MRPAERVQTSKATRHLARLPRSHSLIMDGVALVTGGASGVSLIWTEITGRTSSIQIGAAIVEAFLDKGVRGVTVADIDPGALKSFSTQLRTRFPGAQLLEAVVDVTNEESVKEMLRRTVRQTRLRCQLGRHHEQI